MTALVLLTAITMSQPMPKEVNLGVRGAEPPVNVLRWQLLPPLIEHQPGDMFVLASEAKAKLKEILGADYGTVTDELIEAQKTPLRNIDRKKLRAQIDQLKPVYEILTRAALAERCDWSNLNHDLRTRGIRATLEFVQDFRQLVPLFAVRARLEILEDRPHDAVRSLAHGLWLSHRLGQGPTLINHLVAVAITTVLLEQFDVILTHPNCPNLHGALTLLPSPFLNLRAAMEGEQTFALGTFPSIVRLMKNPEGPLPTAEEIKQFTQANEGLARDLGINLPAPERLLLALAIQLRHETTLKELTARGYPPDRLKQWPPLVVAIVYALEEYEEKLGRRQQAITLPFPQARLALQAMDDELKKSNPLNDVKAPAIPLARLLLPATGRVLLASARVDRRLAALRVVEALRLHAARNGAWPKTLAEITTVPVPLDPVTGKAFDYRVEGDVAILHGAAPPKEQAHHELFYRLKLRKE